MRVRVRVRVRVRIKVRVRVMNRIRCWGSGLSFPAGLSPNATADESEN